MSSEDAESRDALLAHQAALARFGELALHSQDLDEILGEACRLVGGALGTDLAKVMQRLEGGFLVRAGVGWKPGIVGELSIEANARSADAFAVEGDGAIVSEDVDTETRFDYPDFMRENGVRAFANVLIPGSEAEPPFGVLEVDSREPRAFTASDLDFLTTYATLIAAAVGRLRLLQALRDALAHKERLLAELQHRVKNNLQVISSLVNMQSRRARATETRAQLEAIGLRIETMRLVHDKIYAADAVDRIDLAPYLSELCGGLLRFYAEGAAGVRLRTELDSVVVAPETALTLGLVVNEFVTNSLKYAFDDGRGTIGVVLEGASDGARLVLKDDGKGFPDDLPSGAAARGTGMALIDGLLTQFGGRSGWRSEDGTELSIDIPGDRVVRVPGAE